MSNRAAGTGWLGQMKSFEEFLAGEDDMLEGRRHSHRCYRVLWSQITQRGDDAVRAFRAGRRRLDGVLLS